MLPDYAEDRIKSGGSYAWLQVTQQQQQTPGASANSEAVSDLVPDLAGPIVLLLYAADQNAAFFCIGEIKKMTLICEKQGFGSKTRKRLTWPPTSAPWT